jgi:hypothetical protein
MTSHAPRLLAVALAAAVTLSACKKDDPAPTVAPASSPQSGDLATAPSPMPPAGSTAAAGVTDLQLGTSVGADNRVASPVASFGVRDTLYASVNSAGETTGTLGARWTFLGTDGNAAPVEVDSQTRPLTAGTAAAHEFHVSKPDGWPAGRYRVEISHNGQTVQTRDFDVR